LFPCDYNFLDAVIKYSTTQIISSTKILSENLNIAGFVKEIIGYDRCMVYLYSATDGISSFGSKVTNSSSHEYPAVSI
jgi:light-regulated signal transduction histidine kinase (bacteriophytochrome)